MERLNVRTESPTTHTKDFKHREKFMSDLLGAIHDEASAIKFYGALENIAPAQYRDFIVHAKNDEMEHLRMFRKLYRKLSGHEASVQAADTAFDSYKGGIEIAFRRELEAAELYRDMYLSTRVGKIRDILFRTMTDEMEHAQRFSFLFFLA